jgi:hypothetical protein
MSFWGARVLQVDTFSARRYSSHWMTWVPHLLEALTSAGVLLSMYSSLQAAHAACDVIAL